ncbi:hypothetical protein SAMN05216390_101138 [Lachnospiraceae bacterium KH1T2]|nr:hypothetical protein SAMN05216390_101138 [Lachnospiraceae bacterium KH1T2]
MEKSSYRTWTEKLRPMALPAEFQKAYEEWEGEGSLINVNELKGILSRYDLRTEKLETLCRYLEEIWESREVSEYVKFICWTQCDRRYEYFIDGNVDFNLSGIGDAGKAINFFICLSCMRQSEKDLIRRKIPSELYEKIPYRMLDGQIEKYSRTGELKVDDMPWSLNFYSHSIYLFDRFLFVPCRYDGIYDFYRKDDEVVGVTAQKLAVDNMGQVINDEESASDSTEKNGYYYGGFEPERKIKFITQYNEDAENVSGNRLSPCGYITEKIVVLEKRKWNKILTKDDWMIGFHIPEGEGYTPEHVRISMKLAMDFFRTYYPEIDFKGFWSASWLYDGRLSMLLSEDSNIVRVQRQFFNYSGGWNGEMAYIELFGDLSLKLDEVPMETTLQRRVSVFLKGGGRLCETGMVYFPEELDKSFEEMIYITSQDLDAEEKLFERNGWKELVYETGN